MLAPGILALFVVTGVSPEPSMANPAIVVDGGIQDWADI